MNPPETIPAANGRAGAESARRADERPLRILYYVDSLGFGGANQTTVTVARRMKQAGHEVVLASAPGPLEQILSESSIPHLRVKTRGRPPLWSTVRRLVGALREHAMDLLCPNGFDCTLDAVPAGILAGVPVVPTYGGLHNHHYPHPRLPRVNVFSLELAAFHVRCHGWDPGSVRNLIARIDEDRFHPGVRGEELRQTLAIGPRQPVLVMICRHDPIKLLGVNVLLDAAPEIHSRIPEARILLLGDGKSHQRILNDVGEINRAAGVEFVLAPGSSSRTAEAFAMADLVVANGARSALEGMACGKPIVSVGPNGFCGALTARTIEGFRRFNFDKGRLAGNPFGGRAQMVDSVAQILGDEQLYRELSRFSLDYARENLLIQRATHDFEALYREAVADPWGRLGRLRTLDGWLRALWGLYRWRYRRARLRRAGRRTVPRWDELLPPDPGIDPEWSTGLPAHGAAPDN